MDVLTTEFKKTLGQRRGVYLISTAHYASEFGIFKVGMAEKSFNHRFSTFKYAGYGAIDQILCFGLICISPHDTKGHISPPTEGAVAEAFCRSLEQDVLQRLTPFRLRYSDTGRKSEWVRSDLTLALGVMGDYHEMVYMSTPTRYVAVQCFGVSMLTDDGKCDKQQRRGVKKQVGDT